MGKGDKQRSNRETKKPKQDKAKAPVVANSTAARPPLSLGAKKPPRS
jgi:hypothetical protein